MITKSALMAMAVVLLLCATASAGWRVYPAPVYVTPVPQVVYSAPPVYVVPAPVIYSAPVVYPAPVRVRTKVYYHGRPVRNVVRAVLP